MDGIWIPFRSDSALILINDDILCCAQTHENHTRESQTLQARIKQLQQLLDESNPDVVKQLRDENNRLKSEAGHATQQWVLPNIKIHICTSNHAVWCSG